MAGGALLIAGGMVATGAVMSYVGLLVGERRMTAGGALMVLIGATAIVRGAV